MLKFSTNVCNFPRCGEIFREPHCGIVLKKKNDGRDGARARTRRRKVQAPHRGKLQHDPNAEKCSNYFPRCGHTVETTKMGTHTFMIPRYGYTITFKKMGMHVILIPGCGHAAKFKKMVTHHIKIPWCGSVCAKRGTARKP